MINTNETTLVSVFYTPDRAAKALEDLKDAHVPQNSITVLGGTNTTSEPEQSLMSLKDINLPAEDLQVLSNGLKSGGTVIIVRADDAFAGEVETIFERYQATEIDELGTTPKAQAVAATAGDGVIPVVEEELVVGKRTVERGGVRVFSRVVETPVEEQVVLREEHARVERTAVNRPISEAEISALANRSIEVQESSEEAVVGKTARVVEEIRVKKDVSEHAEQIKDTVRRTEIEVDQLPADATNPTLPKA